MAMGPHQQMLLRYLVSADAETIREWGERWEASARRIETLQRRLFDDEPVARGGLGRSTGGAVADTLRRSAEASGKKAERLREAAAAFYDAADTIDYGWEQYRLLGEAAGPRPTVYTPTSAVPTPEEVARQQADQEAVRAWDADYEQRERRSAEITQEMSTRFEGPTSTMKSIHGEPDPPPPTYVATSSTATSTGVVGRGPDSLEETGHSVRPGQAEQLEPVASLPEEPYGVLQGPGGETVTATGPGGPGAPGAVPSIGGAAGGVVAGAGIAGGVLGGAAVSAVPGPGTRVMGVPSGGSLGAGSRAGGPATLGRPVGAAGTSMVAGGAPMGGAAAGGARGGAAGAAGGRSGGALRPTVVGGGTSGGRIGGAGSRAGSGAAAGAAGAGAGAGAGGRATGQGRRGRGANADQWGDDQDWIDDEGAAPPVLQ